MKLTQLAENLKPTTNLFMERAVKQDEMLQWIRDTIEKGYIEKQEAQVGGEQGPRL